MIGKQQATEGVLVIRAASSHQPRIERQYAQAVIIDIPGSIKFVIE